MAEIKQYLDAIATAVKGEDVRWSIHDGIDAINKEVIANTTASNNAVREATKASTAAQNAAVSAAESAEAASTSEEAILGIGWFGIAINSSDNVNALISGQFLGESITDEQYEDIKTLNKSIVKLGDFWRDVKQQLIWRVVHVNYPLSSSPNVVIMPDWSLLTSNINSTSSLLNLGIAGSEWWNTQRYQCYEIANNFFGDKLSMFTEYVSKSFNENGYTNGAENKEVYCLLPSVVNFTGYQPDRRYYGKFATQFALFKLNYNYAVISPCWTSTAITPDSLYMINKHVFTYSSAVTQVTGSRPFFMIM